jgi:signal transduction histidine kinase
MDIDISGQKSAETTLLQVPNETKIQNDRLKDFSFLTSHNLRSSVVNLLGLIELLEEEYPGNESVVMVRKMADKLDATIRTMNQLIQFEKSPGQLELESCNIQATVSHVLNLLDNEIRTKKVEIVQSVDAHWAVKANPAYLESIIQNLLTNALKYGLNNEKRQIEVFSFQKGAKIALAVRDDGHGFSMAKVSKRIFKPGARFHSQIADGQGLGHFMTKHQLEMMNGHIEFESEPGKGSIFTIYLDESV